jgi:hypothetical protein
MIEVSAEHRAGDDGQAASGTRGNSADRRPANKVGRRENRRRLNVGSKRDDNVPLVPNPSRESKQFSFAMPIKPVGFLPHVFKYFGPDNRRQLWHR